MKRRLWWFVPLGVGVLALAGVSAVVAAQRTDCRSHVPAVGPVLDVQSMPFVRNFDPCTNRLTMTDGALKPTCGPYISKEEAERHAVGSVRPTKVRSYFGRYDDMYKLLGIATGSTEIYPDREVWLVVVQAPDQGPVPSLKATVKPWPRRWYYRVLDATTGRLLGEGGNGANDGDWPATLPAD